MEIRQLQQVCPCATHCVPKAMTYIPRYFRKFEKFHPSKDYSLVDVTLRGSSGPVHGKAIEAL